MNAVKGDGIQQQKSLRTSRGNLEIKKSIRIVGNMIEDLLTKIDALEVSGREGLSISKEYKEAFKDLIKSYDIHQELKRKLKVAYEHIDMDHEETKRLLDEIEEYRKVLNKILDRNLTMPVEMTWEIKELLKK